MVFRNKIIFIVSREDFEGMLMSKQNYAIELSRMNNKVYFIHHPELRKKLRRGAITLEKTMYENLMLVKHRFIHPYFFKFKYLNLYYFLTQWHLKRLIRKIGEQPDVVWQFDIGNSLPLKYFPAKARKIYMPVDGPYNTIHEKDAAESAEIILSVTDKILEQYKNVPVPKYMINHGVSIDFINQNTSSLKNEIIQAGYSGSLLRDDLDTALIKLIISGHPNVHFHFWGENNPAQSNVHLLQDISKEILSFLSFLNNVANVTLHGSRKTAELARGLKGMDVLLVLYKPNDDNTKNSHKILEYLATGKVIVSSYMSSYSDKRSELIEMVNSKENNDELPALFAEVTSKLDYYNSSNKTSARIEFASAFSYPNQVKKIEKFLTATKHEQK